MPNEDGATGVEEIDTPDVTDGGVGDEGGDKPYLGTYKTREDAEKGLAEKDRTLTRLAAEKDAADKRASKVEEILERLTAAQEARSEGNDKKQEQIEAQITRLVDDLGESLSDDPKKGARKILEVINGYLSDTEGRFDQKLSKTMKSEFERLQAELADVRKQLEERDPEYVSVKDKVTELAQELGLDPAKDRQLLTRLAKREMKTIHPERHELPGGVESTRASGGGGGTVRAEDIAQIERLTGRKMTDAEKRTLSRKYAGRV